MGVISMLRDAEQTIGNMIDKQGISFIGSVDSDGFPNTKAMLPPRKREGIKFFLFYNQYLVRAGGAISYKSESLYLFLR
jgi:hypothetical protein